MVYVCVINAQHSLNNIITRHVDVDDLVKKQRLFTFIKYYENLFSALMNNMI